MMGTNCSSCAIGLAGCCGCCGCCCARLKPGPPKCVWKAPYRMLHAHETHSLCGHDSGSFYCGTALGVFGHLSEESVREAAQPGRPLFGATGTRHKQPMQRYVDWSQKGIQTHGPTSNDATILPSPCIWQGSLGVGASFTMWRPSCPARCRAILQCRGGCCCSAHKGGREGGKEVSPPASEGAAKAAVEEHVEELLGVHLALRGEGPPAALVPARQPRRL